MATQPSLSAVLAASYAALSLNSLPPEVLTKAKTHIMDLVGVALGGAHHADVAPVHQVFAAMGGAQESTVWGRGDRLPMHAAAMINSSNALALELDDTHRNAYTHVGTVVTTTAIGVGEHVGASGEAILRAVIAGYDITVRTALSVCPEHRYQGYHPVATVGVFGAALTASLLLGLTPAEIVNALGIAGTQSAGFYQFQLDGCSSKRFHAGRAAQSGIFAAQLARSGMTGSPEIYEGKYGFGTVMSPVFRPEALTDRLGEHWHILDMGMKPYGSCRMCHTAIDAVFALREHPDWNLERLESLELLCGKQLMDQTGDPEPTSYVGAQMSTPNSMAVALIKGASTPRVVERHYHDDDVMALTRKIVLTLDKSLPVAARQVRLTARVAGAAPIVIDVALPSGEPEKPITPEALEAKFRDMCACAISPSQTEALKQTIASLERLDNIRNMIPLLLS